MTQKYRLIDLPPKPDIGPIFIQQTAEHSDPDKQRRWIKAAVQDARLKGCNWFRAAQHETIPNLILLEGWAEQPKEEGEPRFTVVEAQDAQG